MEPVPVRRSIALALLTACAGLLALGFWVLRSPGTESVAFEPAQEEVRPAAPDADLERAEDEPGESRRSASQPETEPTGRARFAPPDPSTVGKLRIRAVDAGSGAALDRLRVRVASDTRFADRDSGPGPSQLLLTLTPDSYTVLALSRGYEPLEVPGLEVVAGAELAPEPLRLRPASARVEGFAFGDLRPENKLQAELLGEGRSPCERCAGSGFAEREKGWARSEPCAACGYAVHSSRLALPADGRFAFEHLVSGKYALRVLDARGQPLGIGQSFELLEGQALRVEIEAPGLRTLEVEVLDTDGSSLAGEWAARLRGSAGDEVVEIVEGHAESAAFVCTLLADERYVAHALFVPPEPADRSGGGGTSIGASRHGYRPGRTRAKGPDDRARAPGDTLRLAANAPVLRPAAVEAAVGADGLARFEPVPAFDLRLEMSSGPFRARVAIPAGVGGARVQARLERNGPPEGSTYRDWERGGRR